MSPQEPSGANSLQQQDKAAAAPASPRDAAQYPPQPVSAPPAYPYAPSHYPPQYPYGYPQYPYPVPNAQYPLQPGQYMYPPPGSPMGAYANPSAYPTSPSPTGAPPGNMPGAPMGAFAPAAMPVPMMAGSPVPPSIADITAQKSTTASGVAVSQIPVVTVDAQPSAIKAACACTACTTGWILFGVGFIFPILWLICLCMACCARNRGSRNAAIASAVMLVVYATILGVLLGLALSPGECREVANYYGQSLNVCYNKFSGSCSVSTKGALGSYSFVDYCGKNMNPDVVFGHYGY